LSANHQIREERGKTMLPRVLLADDDEAVRSMLQVALECDGFEVVAVASGSLSTAKTAELFLSAQRA
jgi:CheY-like chemotaxis protein